MKSEHVLLGLAADVIVTVGVAVSNGIWTALLPLHPVACVTRIIGIVQFVQFGTFFDLYDTRKQSKLFVALMLMMTFCPGVSFVFFMVPYAYVSRRFANYY